MVIDHIHERYARAPLTGIAWSAGAYGLVQYLQKSGENTPLVAAICQSGCLDFVQAVKDILANENKAYPLFLLGQARICIQRHINNDKRIGDKAPFYRLLQEELGPMELFDRFYSLLPAPLPDTTGGYGCEGFVVKNEELSMEVRMRNAPHYAHKIIDNMDKIKITTLILHSEDDPIVASEHVNWEKCIKNRHVIAIHTHRGGHCAWHEGIVPWGETWGDRISCKFISAVLETQVGFFCLNLLDLSICETLFLESMLSVHRLIRFASADLVIVIFFRLCSISLSSLCVLR
jgi:hypothetical protein